MTENIPPEDDLDDELELEPVDPEILEYERKRAQQTTRTAEDSVDINEVFEDLETEDPFNLEDLKHFRFTTRHLLILTALVAVALALNNRLGACMAVFVSGCLALAAGWWLVLRQEKRMAEERKALRRAERARIEASRAAEDGVTVPEPEEAEEETSVDQPAFKFSFSVKQLLAALAVAAIFLTAVRWLGGPEQTALVLGFIALLGLILQATGFDPPEMIVLCWWIVLVLYILASLWAVISSSQTAMAEPLPIFWAVEVEPGDYLAATTCSPNQALTFRSSTSSGTEPLPSTTSWKARTSKASPNRSSALARNSRIFISPVLYASA